MSVTLTYPTLTASPATKAEIESNFTTLVNKFGSISNADIAAGAAVDVDKLSAQYEYIFARLSTTDTTAAASIRDYFPVYNDGKGAWTVSGASYITADAGSAAFSIEVLFGYPTDASTTFTTSTTVVAATAITASDGNYRHGNLTVSGSTITPSANNESLALRVSTAGTASGSVWVTLSLKRKIST